MKFRALHPLLLALLIGFYLNGSKVNACTPSNKSIEGGDAVFKPIAEMKSVYLAEVVEIELFRDENIFFRWLYQRNILTRDISFQTTPLHLLRLKTARTFKGNPGSLTEIELSGCGLPIPVVDSRIIVFSDFSGKATVVYESDGPTYHGWLYWLEKNTNHNSN